MSLASLSDSGAPRRSNNALLAAARNELEVADAACERLLKTQQLTQALVARMSELAAVTPEQLPGYLTKYLASAKHSPPREIACTIRDSVLNNIRQALEKALRSIAPDAQEALKFLRGDSTQSLEFGPPRAELAISKGSALLEVVQSCSTHPCAIDTYTKLASALDEFVTVARQCFSQIGTARLKSLAKQFVAELEAHDQSPQAAQQARLPSRDSELYRNILLAVDLYELGDNDAPRDDGENVARHLHFPDTQGTSSNSLNSLYRQLPPAHSIDTNELSEALTSIVGDSSLAADIAQTFHATSTWYQGEYPVVQSILKVSTEQMDLLLNSWSFRQLRKFADSCAELRIGIKVASEALFKEQSLLTSPSNTLDLLREVSEYVAQLSPLERYLPRISPRISPEDFLRPQGIRVAQHWLGRVRADDITPATLSRLAARNALAQLLAHNLNYAKDAATVLVYGFDSRTDSPNEQPLVADLTGPVPLHTTDLTALGIKELASKLSVIDNRHSVDEGHMQACCELADRKLLRVRNASAPRASHKGLRAALSTKVELVRNQSGWQPAMWDHIIAILDALKPGQSNLPDLLHQTDEIISSSVLSSDSHKRDRGSARKQRKQPASPDEIHQMISGIQRQLNELSPDIPQHELKRKIDRLNTSVTALEIALLSQSTSASLEQLLGSMTFSPRLAPSDALAKSKSAQKTLTAIANLVAGPTGGAKV